MNSQHERSFLHALLHMIPDGPLQETCEELLVYATFWTWPASLSFHHAYETGLIQHTLEVVEIAGYIATKFPQVNKDVLIAAALWHDLGKIREYDVIVYSGHHEVPEKGKGLQKDAYGEDTEYWVRAKDVTSHIITSAQEFVVAARKHGVDRETENAVVHCILSHHGPVKEWGSPEAPRTLEALLLHQADLLSAKFGATK